MKTYTVTFMASAAVTIPANSEDEARELFEGIAQEDAIRALAMNGIEVTDVLLEEGVEDIETETKNADGNVCNLDKSNDAANCQEHGADDTGAGVAENNGEFDIQSILKGLDELILDRKSFLNNDPDSDEMFLKDIAVLDAAKSRIHDNSVGDKEHISKQEVIDKAEKLLQDNEQDLTQASTGCDSGYAEGYHDALLDILKFLGSHLDEPYYN